MPTENTLLYLPSTMAQVWAALVVFQVLFYKDLIQTAPQQTARSFSEKVEVRFQEVMKNRTMAKVLFNGILPIVMNAVFISFSWTSDTWFKWTLLGMGLIGNGYFLWNFLRDVRRKIQSPNTDDQ